MESYVKHQYMPIDLPYCINNFLERWKPKALILLETEIWPNLMHACKERKIFTALVNARLSEKSKLNYKKINSLISPSLENMDLILAQFESDAKRIKELISSKDVFGDHPNCSLALVESPHNTSISAGLIYFLDCNT